MGGNGSGIGGSESIISRHSSSLYTSRVKICYCGVPAALRTSHTPRNYKRQFFGCPNFRTTQDCHFFEWFEEPTCRTCVKNENMNKRWIVLVIVIVITFGIIMWKVIKCG